MFKHTIEYTDFNGNPRKEDFYFHLAVHEVTRLQAEIGGKSIEEYTQELINNQDSEKMISFLEKMILSSYGQKTTDGKSFRKTKEIREDFEYSQAYAELFEQLILNPELSKKFGAGIVDNGKEKKNVVAPQVVAE